MWIRLYLVLLPSLVVLLSSCVTADKMVKFSLRTDSCDQCELVAIRRTSDRNAAEQRFSGRDGMINAYILLSRGDSVRILVKCPDGERKEIASLNFSSGNLESVLGGRCR